VICAGSAIAFNNTGVNAVLDAFYPGQAGGLAVADVILGDYNPAGRLPITFYTGTEELPNFTDYGMDAGNGRTYRYYRGTPLYLFGHGLSYTSFVYSALKIRGNPANGESVKVKFAVRNNGSREGDEVMQVYVSAHRAGEPIKSLKWFGRRNFRPSEAETMIEAVLEPMAFAVFDENETQPALGVGKFTISVGGSSGGDLQSVEVEFRAEKGASDAGRVIVIAGIAAGGLLLIAVIVGVVCIIRDRRRSNLEKYPPPSLMSA
jgi:beta-glucosidase